MTKKVFVSSTSRDLQDYRKAAIDSVIRCEMLPLTMDFLAATSKSPIEYSIGEVDKADIYVGIFAYRYGYVPDDPNKNPDRISITEMEYRRAIERQIPTLIFIMDESVPLTRDQFETGEAEEKLNNLKNELTTEYVVSFFTSLSDLSSKVLQSLKQL